MLFFQNLCAPSRAKYLNVSCPHRIAESLHFASRQTLGRDLLNTRS
jgi:hypothetical protein